MNGFIDNLPTWGAPPALHSVRVRVIRIKLIVAHYNVHTLGVRLYLVEHIIPSLPKRELRSLNVR